MEGGSSDEANGRTTVCCILERDTTSVAKMCGTSKQHKAKAQNKIITNKKGEGSNSLRDANSILSRAVHVDLSRRGFSTSIQKLARK